jgi:UDP-N-acetylglucosamine--N-acetylmuramyl-(pentapeptide) pyrophosphoryl-undecaprenol N-acetylglucosamine transferase
LEKRKQILILAAGGGHTGFAYSLAQRLKEKASMTFLIPLGDKLSYNRLSKFGKVKQIPKPRGAKTSMSNFVYNFIKSLIASIHEVSSKFDVVVSTGSNFCIPPSFLAFLRRIKIINIEGEVRFTQASLTARILQPISSITALQWPEQKKLLDGIVVGPIFHKPEIKPWNGGYILVTGGTQGHKKLFDALNESDWNNIVLQTGEINPEPYRKRHPEWKIIHYSSKFTEILAGADLVLTHFGSTAMESVVFNKPTVMILNPDWKRTVGDKDAKIFAKKIGAKYLSEINLKSLSRAIENTKKDNNVELKDGAKSLADIILNMK